MSLAEYKSRQRKLKPKTTERERHERPTALPPAVAKTQPMPVSTKNAVNSPPPAPVKQSTKSGFLIKYL